MNIPAPPTRQLDQRPPVQRSIDTQTEAVRRIRLQARHDRRRVVLPDEDVVEVSKRFDDLHAQSNPATAMGKILVRRVAFLSIRLER